MLRFQTGALFEGPNETIVTYGFSDVFGGRGGHASGRLDHGLEFYGIRGGCASSRLHNSFPGLSWAGRRERQPSELPSFNLASLTRKKIQSPIGHSGFHSLLEELHAWIHTSSAHEIITFSLGNMAALMNANKCWLR